MSKEVIGLHGVPRSIVSGSNAKLLSYFLLTLWNKLGTKLEFSTTCHPQTDGQTKVTNRTLGVILRALIKTQAKAWDLLLPHIEFAYNQAPHKTTGLSSLRVLYGVDALTPRELVPRVIREKPSVKDE